MTMWSPRILLPLKLPLKLPPNLALNLHPVFDQGCRMQSPAFSKHHYPVKPSFSVPLAVLGQGGGG